jgi:hypothetical protein
MLQGRNSTSKEGVALYILECAAGFLKRSGWTTHQRRVHNQHVQWRFLVAFSHVSRFARTRVCWRWLPLIKLEPVFGWPNFVFRLHLSTNLLLLEDEICGCKALLVYL